MKIQYIYYLHHDKINIVMIYTVQKNDTVNLDLNTYLYLYTRV